MREGELLQCQIHRWYPHFHSISIPTIIHPLPESFIFYLLEDGLFLPPSSEAMPSRTKASFPELQAEDYHYWREEDQDEDEPRVPTFPELEDAVRASIQKLGGNVFPKLNWSAPKDTAWISSSGSLKCRNFGEIVLLLKASDTLVHDLCHAFDSCEDKVMDRPRTFVLALRKWYDLRPEMEFRGFVRGGVLVGACQREMTGFYHTLLDRVESLESTVFAFFVDNLSEQFPLENYTFDCYVTTDWRVKLIDFNPWEAFTLPLLFSWDELEENFVRLMTLLERLEESEAEVMHSEIGSTRVAREVTADMKDMCIVDGDRKTGHVGGKTQLENAQENCSILDDCDHIEVGIEMEGDNIKDRLYSSETISRESFHSSSKPDENRGEARVIENGTGKFPEEVSLGRKAWNIKLREQGYRAQFKIVKSEGHVQPNLRMGGGVPYDYVDTGHGSAWDEFLRNANEELQKQIKNTAAGA
eukprot:c25897_g1_i1 orf=90-1502(+)